MSDTENHLSDESGDQLLADSGCVSNEMETNSESTAVNNTLISNEERQGSHACNSAPEFYRGEYPVTQINGCRQYGPPRNWIGLPPRFGCEIFVKRIPPEFTERELVPVFERFGRLYEMRLMMDYDNRNRGYCFVRYASEYNAKVAIQVLNHHYVKDNRTFDVQESFEKSRLFVGNLPKNVDRTTIEISFRALFPEMTRFVMHNRISDGNMHRGFAFMDFSDHAAALRAKKQATPGCLRIWEQDIKIVWANPQRSLDHSSINVTKTLFIRNIDTNISKEILQNLFSDLIKSQKFNISRVREFAFVEFPRRDQAEYVMQTLQGRKLNNFQLDVEWAMPHLRNSFHSMKNYDFDSLLRIKCIANNWDPPIILYGRIFALSRIQHAVVIMRHNGQAYAYFVEISFAGLWDIQSRIYEALITIIREDGKLPENNLFINVKDNRMNLIGSIFLLDQPVLNLAQGVDLSLKVFWDEIVDLCAVVNQILNYSFDDLYCLYWRELERPEPFCYLETIQLQDRIVGCLNQNFRDRPPLNGMLDNREVVLVLCDRCTLSNYNFSKKKNYIAQSLSSIENCNFNTVKFATLQMMPASCVQAPSRSLEKIEAVFYGPDPYVHAEIHGNQHISMSNYGNIHSGLAYDQQFGGGQLLAESGEMRQPHQLLWPAAPQPMYAPLPPPGFMAQPLPPHPFFVSPLNRPPLSDDFSVPSCFSNFVHGHC
ncbi:uncharacterized protein LOC129777603 [Toxorhynchites rutilus septentrionalis]|uniref:uncharacterized protein LOC129777603 n=1 Tax=Toxorhynchites rutilus septentrionalis TaxID=329112 RepID=UPI002478DEF8|nr:uncharacterized protein LOC129777603 [Toxorhynchites rutilus septentrionalis]